MRPELNRKKKKKIILHYDEVTINLRVCFLYNKDSSEQSEQNLIHDLVLYFTLVKVIKTKNRRLSFVVTFTAASH